MSNFSDDEILKLDEEFAREGIPFHARPFRAAIRLLGNDFSMSVGGNPQVSEIETAYAQLIPEVLYTWPGMGAGLAASIDRVKKVTIGVVFGTVNIPAYRGLGFANITEWNAWCRGDARVAAKSAFAYADMHDLVYGIPREAVQETWATFWGLASQQLNLVADSLSQTGKVTSAVLQPICLTAELALKGTLLRLGLSEKELKDRQRFGHNLQKLGERICQETDHRDNAHLLRALAKFPDYVDNRYRETQLTRMEVIDLALDAQFAAASAVRRVSNSDLALQIETSDAGPRGNYFP